MLTLIPAYGRDYKSARKVKEDYNKGKDFLIADISSPYDGKYVSVRSLQSEQVKIRFNRLTKTTII